MSLDITPLVPAGRQLIQKYGDGTFTIAGARHTGSVLVFPEETVAWPVSEPGPAMLETMDAVFSRPHAGPILLIGCGERFFPPPKGLRDGVKARGLALEWMDTGAACRTFNVLLVEDRIAAAALIAVD